MVVVVLYQPNMSGNIARLLLIYSQNCKFRAEFSLKEIVPLHCGVLNALAALYRTFINPLAHLYLMVTAQACLPVQTPMCGSC